MSIKIISLNIEHGGVLMDRALSFLKNENPDILFLQEAQDNLNNSSTTHFNTIKSLGELKYPHAIFKPHYEVVLDGVTVRHGPAVLSRYPLSFQKHVFFDVPYGLVNYEKNKQKQDFSQIPQSMLYLSVDINGKSVDLYNVHGIWGSDGRDSERRFQMINTIIAELIPGHTTIMAGDFNMQPDTQAIAQLGQHLHNVFGTSLQSTFNMKRKTNPGYASAAVDMMFISHDIKVKSAQCPQVEISDHLPLVAELEL